MEIRRGGGASETYGGRFTGTAAIEMLLEAPDARQPDTAHVRFRDGAATAWHRHPGGQLLYVLEGRARVGTADGEVELEPGTLVHAPADERHWHGAARGASCTFLALTWGTTAWEDEYPPA